MCSNPACPDHPRTVDDYAGFKADADRFNRNFGDEKYNYVFATSEVRANVERQILRGELYISLREAGYPEDMARTIENAAYIGLQRMTAEGFER